jgi:transposase
VVIAYAPWRLALVTIFQFLEKLTDRQAADAVRSRLDWKYSLSLDRSDPGFDHTVLSEFRTRLVAASAEERFLEAVLTLCKERGWLKAHGRQRTDSTHVLAKVRALNRAECVVETLRHTLNVLAVVAPDWLRSQVQPEWLERYGHRAEEYRLPSSTAKRQQFLHQVGQDGWRLPAAFQTDPQHHWMLSIQPLRPCRAYGNKNTCLPNKAGRGFLMRSDWTQQNSTFLRTIWMPPLPRSVPSIGLATRCIVPKPAMRISLGCSRKCPRPSRHLVDAGYIDAEALVSSQKDYRVDLVGPTAKDYRWQAREQNGYALANFSIDWERKLARYPQGQISSSWTPPGHATRRSSKSSLGLPSAEPVQFVSSVPRPSDEACLADDKKRILP